MKITYIYHVLAGYNGRFDKEDFFIYARNSDIGREFCKEYFKTKKYDSYKLIKVGESRTPQETQIISDQESEQLRNTQAVKGEHYREIRNVSDKQSNKSITFDDLRKDIVERVSGASI